MIKAPQVEGRYVILASFKSDVMGVYSGKGPIQLKVFNNKSDAEIWSKNSTLCKSADEVFIINLDIKK